MIAHALEHMKEIAIRKVFGASMGSILLLIAGGYRTLIILSFLIEVPCSLLVDGPMVS